MLRLIATLVLLAGFAAIAPTIAIPLKHPAPNTEQQAEPPQSADQRNQDANQEHGSSATAPLYVKAACNHGCGYSEDTKSWLDKLWTDPVATFTAALAGLTLGLIGVGIMQGVFLYRANVNSEKAFAASRRAFVYASGFTPGWEIDPTTGLYNWRFRAKWTNSGETPTEGLKLYIDAELRTTPLPTTFDFIKAVTPGSGLLGPKQESMGGAAPVSPTPAITPTDITDIIMGRKYLYLWGWVRYRDVFPETEAHITRICWCVMPIGNPVTYNPNFPLGAGGQLNFGYVLVDFGNCADNECRVAGLG